MLAVNSSWSRVEDLFETVWFMDFSRPILNPALKGNNSYEKHVRIFYTIITELIWLTGNTQVLCRGTGSAVELIMAILHFRHQLPLPALQREFPQFDVLDLSFPLSDYLFLLPYCLEPGTIPEYLTSAAHKTLSRLSALKQIQYLYNQLYPQPNFNAEIHLEDYPRSLSTHLNYLIIEAAAEDQSPLIELLHCLDADLNTQRTEDGFGPIHSAALNNAQYNMRFFLQEEHKVVINQQCKTGETAISIAAAQNHEKMTELLLAKKGDPNIINCEGNNALHRAVQNDAKGAVHSLLESGRITINQTSSYGRTAAYIATLNTNLTILSNLASHGADLNKEDPQGFTPLHIAASNGQLQLVIFLLNHHVEILKPSNKGHTALNCALTYNYWEIAVIILLSVNLDELKVVDVRLIRANKEALIKTMEDRIGVHEDYEENLKQLKNFIQGVSVPQKKSAPGFPLKLFSHINKSVGSDSKSADLQI